MGSVLKVFSRICSCCGKRAQARSKEGADSMDEEAGPLINKSKKKEKKSKAEKIFKNKRPKQQVDMVKSLKKSKENIVKSKENMVKSKERKPSLKQSSGMKKSTEAMKESVRDEAKSKGVKFQEDQGRRTSFKAASGKSEQQGLEDAKNNALRESVSEPSESRKSSKQNTVKLLDKEEEEKNEEALELQEDEKVGILEKDDFDDNYPELLKEIDTLTENQQKEIARVFRKNKALKPKKYERNDEELDCVVTVNKINRYNMSQKRVLLISTFAIYNVLTNDLTFVTNRLDLSGIDCLIHDSKGTQMIIKSKQESGSKSIWIQSDYTFAVAAAVNSVYFQLFNDNIRSFFFSKKEMKQIYNNENFMDFLKAKERERHDLFNKIEKKYSSELDKAGRVEALIEVLEAEIYEKKNFKSPVPVTILLSNIQMYVLKLGSTSLIRKISYKYINMLCVVVSDQSECLLKISELINEELQDYKTDDLIVKHVRTHMFCKTLKESIEKSLKKEGAEIKSVAVQTLQTVTELRGAYEIFNPKSKKSLMRATDIKKKK